MARYIDLDGFADRLLNAWNTADEQKRADIVAIMANIVTPILVGTPTADVEEVRHGEWIKKNGIYVCSECDFTCPYDVVGDNIEYWECLYCPHCGAKMDGGKAE